MAQDQQPLDDFKVYVYTLPKAGTYFIAEFLTQLGFGNSGLHVSLTKTLRTNDFDAETNAQYPSKTSVAQPFIRSLREVKMGETAFGHLPVPLFAPNFGAYLFICAYRHPRKTLVSEFIDFRFRRKDVEWVSPETIPNDQEAFATYMERHGRNHLSIMTSLMAVSALVNEPMFEDQYPPERFFFVNFDDLRHVPSVSEGLCAFLQRDRSMAAKTLEATLNADTKTKATDITVDRDALWSDKAEEFYDFYGVERMVAHARGLGWTL